MARTAGCGCKGDASGGEGVWCDQQVSGCISPQAAGDKGRYVRPRRCESNEDMDVTNDNSKRQPAQEGNHRLHWRTFWIINQHMVHPGKAQMGWIGEQGQGSLHFFICERTARGGIGL